jgi:hypothetical protein
MAPDPIIAEIRQAREALAARFNYDLHAMIQDARQRQAASGRRVVSFAPKPVRKTIHKELKRTRVADVEQ